MIAVMSTLTELQKRILTGLLGGAALLTLLIYGGPYGTALLAALLALAMMYEFIELTFSLPDKGEKRWVLLGTTWLIAFVNFWIPRAEYALLLISFLGVSSYFLFTAHRHQAEAFSRHFRELALSVFGVIYLAFLPLFLVLIRDLPGGQHWILLFFLIVWAGDTGAYFAGRAYGRRSLYPEISPKKTMEGAAGGILAGLIVSIFYKLVFFQAMPWPAAVMLPLLVGVAAIVGDLAESFLKRAFEMKDSGSLLPGHGGFLDRFDGIVFGAPVMFACLRLFV